MCVHICMCIYLYMYICSELVCIKISQKEENKMIKLEIIELECNNIYMFIYLYICVNIYK
jgi:hypothetical protein